MQKSLWLKDRRKKRVKVNLPGLGLTKLLTIMRRNYEVSMVLLRHDSKTKASSSVLSYLFLTTALVD